MTLVTKESLTARIAELEAGPRSLKEDYYLAVMRELLPHLGCDCAGDTVVNTRRGVVCSECGFVFVAA